MSSSLHVLDFYLKESSHPMMDLKDINFMASQYNTTVDCLYGCSMTDGNNFFLHH